MAPATGRRVASFSKGPSPEPIRRGPATMAFPETMQVAVAAVLGGAAAASGLVLAGRRLAGGFSGSEPGLVWIAMAAGIALVAAAAAEPPEEPEAAAMQRQHVHAHVAEASS